MSRTVSRRVHRHGIGLCVFLVIAALVIGMVACDGSGGDNGGNGNGDELLCTLGVASTNGGSVTTPGEGQHTYDCGTVVPLVAEADEGYRFVNWTGDAETIANVNSCITTITMHDDYSVTGNFQTIPPGQFSLTISSTSGGSVSAPGEATFIYDEGTVVDLVATPDIGYHFVSWTGDVGTVADVNAATTAVTMLGDYSITATFGITEPLQVFDWYDLDAIRNNPDGNYILVNDLDCTTPGYVQLASPTANDGRGWQPIADYFHEFTGLFDGQGYEIRDLCINRGGQSGVGLFGHLGEAGTIRNVKMADFVVTGNNSVGGLVGVTGWGDTSVSNCHASGTVNGISNVGGLIGLNPKGFVSDSSSIGTVTGEDHAGGLAGSNYEDGTVINCFSSGSVSGNEWVGGLLGSNSGLLVDSCSSADVDGELTVGGLVGACGGAVSRCCSSGSVSGTGTDVGGLAGWNTGTMTNCYSTGNVTGGMFVGGLVGRNFEVLRYSYSSGAVTGTSYVGGLVGSNWDIVSSSFWDIQTSGQGTSDGGTGKTTEKMQDIATFSGAAWDIVAVADPSTRNVSCIWNIVNNETYPLLSWEPAS